MMTSNRWILLAVFALPAAFAHTSGIDGTPKSYCEDVQGDTNVHDYGPPATNLVLFAARDGSPDSCGGGLAQDGHLEYAMGGAYLLAGASASTCWGVAPDHPTYPTITVNDSVLGTAVPFSVWVDTDPLPCGDFEADSGIDCTSPCNVSILPGVDGSYHVYVLGTAGHVST